MVPAMSLEAKLDKIRSPNLQNQKENAVVLSALEATIREQHAQPTPTAYFAALLALLGQSISQESGIVNKELATAVVYLLDIVIPFTPQPLLRSKFYQILIHLATPLTHKEAEAPLLKPAIGCLETLLVAQDSASWSLPPSQVGPRAAMALLLELAVDPRPKVRKHAQDALKKVLQSPPPSPALDHPAADLCAQTSLRRLSELALAAGKTKKSRGHENAGQHEPALIHALQLIKAVAAAAGGWPSKKIEPLCEVLLNISKSTNEYLTMATFEVFEIIFTGMADDFNSSKLPRLLDAISELRPSQNDSQLLPPWIAIMSRGYEVWAQVDSQETFQKLPEIFDLVAGFLASSAHNIRVSASECLVSLLENCIPNSALLSPSIYDEKVLEKLARLAIGLLSVNYQAAWVEVFTVLVSMFSSLSWKANPIMFDVVKTVGELRGNDSFAGKKEADEVLGSAVRVMGPEAVLKLLPLNLMKPKAGQPGRAWLLPILRDHVWAASLMHFRSEFVPLSEAMFQRVLDHGEAEKTMEIKIYETLVQQIWALLPGYCELTQDLPQAFDQGFAELISNLLYQQVGLRVDICRALHSLVQSNQSILQVPEDEELLLHIISKERAQKSLDHLASLAGNLLAVLFNVYSQTLPQHRGHILKCIDAYLEIIPQQELMETFTRVTTALEGSLVEAGPQTQASKQKQQGQPAADKMPPMSHTLMDLVITISVHLPRESFSTLFQIASVIITKDNDAQLQKKAYKLIPRLASTPTGSEALQTRSEEVQHLLLASASTTCIPSRRDRLLALSTVVSSLSPTSLHFIPTILSEVVIACKETNEKARTAAFELLTLMGRRMAEGGLITAAKVPHLGPDAADIPATLEEYFTMLAAGLAGGSPHVVAASVAALARCLYEFGDELADETKSELVQTMDLFLTSPNREIVRAVLGFVKVAVIALPKAMVQPRLASLVPHLLAWGKEHKNQFKAKVKHIMERLMRRFGTEIVEKVTPEEDWKLVRNIRKAKDARKRRKDAAKDDGEEEDEEAGSDAPNAPHSRRSRQFDSAFDEVAYGSDSDVSSLSNPADSDDDPTRKRHGRGSTSTAATASKKRGSRTYIHEDPDEPLDLLGTSALAHLSSTKPPRRGDALVRTRKRGVQLDAEGKLVFREGGADGEAMLLEPDHDDANGNGNGDSGVAVGGQTGTGAYLEALSGKHAVQRGRGGKLKFRGAGTRRDGRGHPHADPDADGDADGDQMDLDLDQDATAARRGRDMSLNAGRNGAGRDFRAGRGARGGRGRGRGRDEGRSRGRGRVNGGRGGGGGDRPARFGGRGGVVKSTRGGRGGRGSGGHGGRVRAGRARGG